MPANRRARPAKKPDRSVKLEPGGKYVVVGHRVVHGFCTGELVDKALTPGEAAALVAAGHIALAVEHKASAHRAEEAGHVAIAETPSKER